ncbi:hypothetical protein [Xenorhabdus bovienii]|uniref:Uncharacterized protein n=1 Tax=Xenorhabdus bovienii TaxID=40576 RepID=A0A0B6X5I4_XENBV|nr:hypothetical protein [Xenorhabdus bovienii]CDM89127.1 conserved protein of unknown function [Xenorhabdus bovienii]
MSKRKDIIDGSLAGSKRSGLVYTELLGWIDLGHARGDDIRKILANMESGDKDNHPYYEVVYTQSMGAFSGRFATSKFTKWRVKKGLSLQDRYSIALTMMMKTAYLFESYQSRWFFNWYTDSGFSSEDLISDLLGFYRVVKPMNYFSIIKPVSKNDALRRWDYYGEIGKYKNRSFNPLIFPDPDKLPNNARPYYVELPGFMKAISPMKYFTTDKFEIINGDGTDFKFWFITI